MTIHSGIFNSVGGDRKYNAEFFAQYFSSFIGNGVFPNPSNSLQVVSNTNMRTVVKAGKGWVNGYYVNNDSDYVLQHDVSHGTLHRIDRIVMRLNYLNRQIEFDIKKGVNASSPVPPTLTRNIEQYELALADVRINNGLTVITQATITDQRLNTSLCGVVHGTVQQVDTTTIFNQYQNWFNQMTVQKNAEFDNWKSLEQSEFNDWFETIQDILNTNVAGNLQNQINAVNNDTIRNPVRGRTSNNGNQYTINDTRSITNYVDDMMLVITPNANATGNVSIRVNNLSYIPVKRSNGQNFKDFYNNSKVTLRYSEAQSAFIVQGEGGGGNAIASDLLAGKTASSDVGEMTGTMINHGAINGTVNAGASYTIQQGYHNGSGKVTGNSLASQTVADATAANILSGKTAWVNGSKLTGTIPSKSVATYTPSTANQTISAGQYLSGVQTIAGDADLVSRNIKQGVNIFGVNGTYSPVSQTVTRAGSDVVLWLAPYRGVIYSDSSLGNTQSRQMTRNSLSYIIYAMTFEFTGTATVRLTATRAGSSGSISVGFARVDLGRNVVEDILYFNVYNAQTSSSRYASKDFNVIQGEWYAVYVQNDSNYTVPAIDDCIITCALEDGIAKPRVRNIVFPS